jgi:hypothetical protein
MTECTWPNQSPAPHRQITCLGGAQVCGSGSAVLDGGHILKNGKHLVEALGRAELLAVALLAGGVVDEHLVLARPRHLHGGNIGEAGGAREHGGWRGRSSRKGVGTAEVIWWQWTARRCCEKMGARAASPAPQEMMVRVAGVRSEAHQPRQDRSHRQKVCERTGPCRAVLTTKHALLLPEFAARGTGVFPRLGSSHSSQPWIFSSPRFSTAKHNRDPVGKTHFFH